MRHDKLYLNESRKTLVLFDNQTINRICVLFVIKLILMLHPLGFPISICFPKLLIKLSHVMGKMPGNLV